MHYEESLPTKKEDDVKYIVQEGETLNQIAQRFYSGRKDYPISKAISRIAKCNSLNESEALNSGITLKLPNAGPLRAFKVYHMRYTCRGCLKHPIGGMHRGSTGKTKIDEARLSLDLKRGSVARGEAISDHADQTTFKELYEDLENDYKLNGLKSLSALKTRWTKHVEPFFGVRRAKTITAREIRQYIVTRQEQEAKNSSINRELALISRAFTLGQKCEKIIFKPSIPRLKENNIRTGWFSGEDFQILCKYLPDDVKAPLVFAFVSGWRLHSEILSREWRHVDLKRGTVMLEVGETKNRMGRLFPLNAELLEVFKEQKARTEAFERAHSVICPLVFHHEGSALIDSHKKPSNYLRKAWKEACASAKLVGKIFHDFRRTAIRNMVRAGVPERVAMQLSGHETREVFERYNIVSEGDLFEATKKLSLPVTKLQTLAN